MLHLRTAILLGFIGSVVGMLANSATAQQPGDIGDTTSFLNENILVLSTYDNDTENTYDVIIDFLPESILLGAFHAVRDNLHLFPFSIHVKQNDLPPWRLYDESGSIYLEFDFTVERHTALVHSFDGTQLLIEWLDNSDLKPTGERYFLVPLEEDERPLTVPHSDALHGIWEIYDINGVEVPSGQRIGYKLGIDGHFEERVPETETPFALPRSIIEPHVVDDRQRVDVRATLEIDADFTEATVTEEVVAVLRDRFEAVAESVSVEPVGRHTLNLSLGRVPETVDLTELLRDWIQLEMRLMADPVELRQAVQDVVSLFESGEENPLLEVMMPMGESVIFGNVLERDTARVNQLLRREEVQEMLPACIELMYSNRQAGYRDDQPIYQLLGVRSAPPELTGEYITDVGHDFDETGRPRVSLTMNSEGAELWSRLTGANVNRHVAMVVDGVIYSFPRIIDRITGGRTHISGMDQTKAEVLAAILGSRPLTAPVYIRDVEVTPSPEIHMQPDAGSGKWNLSKRDFSAEFYREDGRFIVTGTLLLLIYDDDHPVSFFITEMGEDQMILKTDGPYRTPQTLRLRRQ